MIGLSSDQPDAADGSPQPVVAVAGDDVTILYYLDPAVRADEVTVEWSRPDLNPQYVHVRRDGRDEYYMKNPSYQGRTGLFLNQLKDGNVSLRIFKVKLSDEGQYRCYLPSLKRDSFFQLVVGKSNMATGGKVGIPKIQ